MTKLEAANRILEAVKQRPVAALDTGGTSDPGLAEAKLDSVCKDVLERGWRCNTPRYEVELKVPTLKIAVTSPGNFTFQEIVKETTSNATGTISHISGGFMYLYDTDGTFVGSKTLTGQTSGATATGGAVTELSGDQPIGLTSDVLYFETAGLSKADDIVAVDGLLYDRYENAWTFGGSIYATVRLNLAFTRLSQNLQRYIALRAAVEFQRNTIGGEQADEKLLQQMSDALLDLRKDEAEANQDNVADTDFGRRILGTSQGSQHQRI